jgi:hypothetical protein
LADLLAKHGPYLQAHYYSLTGLVSRNTHEGFGDKETGETLGKLEVRYETGVRISLFQKL